jgi:TetR/AcrR family transcriptional regulator
MSTERLPQILDAAYDCFTRHGVRRTTMEDIAAAAGVSRSAAYQYVRNKNDAFRQLATRLFDATLADAATAVATHDDLASKLTAALTAKLGLTLRLWRDSPHAAELLGVNVQLAADLNTAFTVALRDLLTAAVAASPQTPAGTDAAEIAELALALTRGLEAQLDDPDLPVRQLRHGVALLVAGLTKEPP